MLGQSWLSAATRSAQSYDVSPGARGRTDAPSLDARATLPFVKQQGYILMQRPLIAFQPQYIIRFLSLDLGGDGTLTSHRVNRHHRTL